MVIIYILAAIGGLCLLAMVGLLVLLAISVKDERQENEPDIKCALTDDRCIYTSERQTCNGCPIAEEAEK